MSKKLELLPAIDVKSGKAVRLYQGEYERESSYGPPLEVAREFENMGAKLVSEVASKTNDIAGDGTTTATVLAQSIVREGMKYVVSGHNPMDLKRGIDQAVAAAVGELSKISKPCNTTKEIAHALRKEDAYQDSSAATQAPFDTGNNPAEAPVNSALSKKASKVVKVISGRKSVNEEMYDHEKDNKPSQSLKKPKMVSQKVDGVSTGQPEASLVMTGGKTMTGQSRDTIELDPMMKKPSPQSDFPKKANLDKK